MKIIKLSILLLTSLLIVTSSVAAETFTGKWYQIELIVFSQLTQQAIDSEQWPLVVSTVHNLNSAVQLALPGNINPSTSIGYQLLPRKDFNLKREQTKLKRHSDYQVLLHIAWRQPILASNEAKPIHIFGGNGYNTSGQIIATDTYGSGSIPYNTQTYWQIDGTFTISVKRYIDVHLNLLFTTPIDQLTRLSNNDYFSNNANSKLAYFRMIQTRRMRSNELNYFGHPLYGVLLKVTPLKQKQ